MKFKIIISPTAANNLQDAVEYYLLKTSKKIASAFLKDYKETYKS